MPKPKKHVKSTMIVPAGFSSLEIREKLKQAGHGEPKPKKKLKDVHHP